MWFLYITECYPALKKKEGLPFATTRMNLAGAMPGKISQRQTLCGVIYVQNLGGKKLNCWKQSRMVAAGLRGATP